MKDSAAAASEEQREERGAAANVGGSMAAEEEEDECRICRGPGEVGNPLRYPCACRGTIKYVHQYCLLQWLNRRKISHCEVCKHEFSYAPVYAMNAPARLPPWEFVLGLAAKVLWLLGVFQSFAYHFLVWLVVVPFITHWIWEFCFFKGFSEAQSLFMSHLNATTIFTDCLHGFFLSLGMAYVFLGITFIRVVLPLDPRGALGLANGNFAANENAENVGGRQGIARVLQTIKRSLVFLANWWKISVARIMVYLGIVENAVLNELLNVQAPFFLFKENAFVVVASNLVFTVLLVLLPFSLGRITTRIQSLLFSSATAQILSFVVLKIEAALLFLNIKAKDTLNAITYFVLHCYGISMPSQVFEGDSRIPDTEIAKMEDASNVVNGLVSVGLYSEQPSGTPALSDDFTVLIGYMVILAFVLFYFGTLSMVRYARGEPLTVSWLSRIAFRIGAVLSLVVRRFFTLLRQVITIVCKNFLTILKVGVVLGVKVGMFPLICGWWLDVCTLRMFGKTTADRVELFAKYPLWMSLAYWTVGICYLVYVLIHVNLIQEVLRDGVFYFLPNIVVPENFFSRMIECPVFKHARDILLLAGVHGSLMVILVFLPIKLVSLYMPSAFPLKLFYSEAKTVAAVVLRRNENDARNVQRLRQQRVRDLSVVAIIEGSIVGLHAPRKTDATDDGSSGEGLEADSQFALRILILLVLAWMTALVFNSLMIAVPLFLGRTLFEAASHLLIIEGFKADDFCSFIVGSCVIRVVVICIKYVVEHVRTRSASALLSQICQYCMTGFSICALVLLGMFVIPTAIGLLIDLVLIVPIPLSLDEVSVITLQCWMLVDNMHPDDERWLVKVQQAFSDGLARRPALLALKEILVPTLIRLLIVLSTAYMLGRLVLTMLGYPFPVNSTIHRFVWPGYFVFSIMWFCVKVIYAYMIYLHKKIRDDRYCVGRMLQDYDHGEDVHDKENEEENALELQN
ncbi:hypothetical protein TIFTF001_002733 [Ficus carica]|uniref:RING-type E3 ubiquitin transferase n=1 Tax=Ficus carica TaxID=3494 RepID=A0AA87Z943_FICCA|nr:hypothetical protein TIFTF001_002733 [Ficus carica]